MFVYSFCSNVCVRLGISMHVCVVCKREVCLLTECVSVYMWFCLSGGLMDNLSAALAKDCLVRMLTTSV